jgi:hypothetical protein
MTCKICGAIRNAWVAVRARVVVRPPAAPYIIPLLFPGEKIITVERKSDEI